MVEVEHHPNGNIRKILIKNEKGQLHNEGGPAVQSWYPNGQEKYRAYRINGEFYNNKNGPAVQVWYLNGQTMYETFYLNGNRHNDNGPAIQGWDENGKEKWKEYWVNGEELTKEEFHKRINTVEVCANGRPVRISKQSAKALSLI